MRSAGVGEVLAEVLARLPEDQAWIPVLADGRYVAVVPRAALAALATGEGGAL